MSVHAIILAAGQGTRMKSALPKVLHPLGGTPMLARVLDSARAAGASRCHVVLGHGAETVRDWLAATHSPADAPTTVVQERQLGTGHAVQQALPRIPDKDMVLVLYGDVPLVTPATLKALIAAAQTGLALATVELPEPRGYGRILREPDGRLVGIVEEQDASPEQRTIREINTGLLAAPARRLKRWLGKVKDDNQKREFYLTDVAALAAADGIAVATVTVASPEEAEGVNDPQQLAQAERRLQAQHAQRLLREGLFLADPARFDLRGTLKFGRDVHIDVGCVLEGKVELGDDVILGPYCVLRNVSLGAGTRIDAHSVLDTALVGRDCRIGPFARLRPGTQLAERVRIGTFVEVKQSRIGDDTQANHLAYIGDATIGARSNIGAGVITCNYDGADKHETQIGDDAFVGSDAQLIAPVKVGDGAYIAAGSTVTQDVPANALAVCRAREQKIVRGWRRPSKK